MPKWEVSIEADFDNEEAARKAVEEMENIVGLNNGELVDSYTIKKEDDE